MCNKINHIFITRLNLSFILNYLAFPALSLSASSQPPPLLCPCHAKLIRPPETSIFRQLHRNETLPSPNKLYRYQTDSTASKQTLPLPKRLYCDQTESTATKQSLLLPNRLYSHQRDFTANKETL